MSAFAQVSLEELMAKRAGSVDPSKFPDETFDLYSIPAFDKGSPEIVTGAEIGSTKQIVEPNDVLLSKIVPHIRRSWIVGDDRGRRLIASGEWIVYRSDKAAPAYLRHVLVGDPFHAQFMQTVSGVGGSLLRARPAQVAKIAIPLPPLHEQRRIASILDQADALRDKRREAQWHLNSLMQSIFLEMFGDPATNPKRWESVALGTVVKTTSGGTPDRSIDGYYGGSIPWVKSGELHQRLVTATEEHITELGLAKSSAKLMPQGTVLVAMYGATVGAVSQLGVPAATNQAICCMQPSEKILSSYLIAFMQQYTPTLLMRRVGGAQPNLSQDLLRNIQLPVPTIEIQHKYAERLTSLEKLIEKHEQSLTELDSLFSSLQHRAFRGEL